MTSHYVPSIILVVSRFTNGNLLGAGKGLGSCAAYPFRSYDVHWSLGCPHHASCCSEFGYCRPKEEWDHGNFRDCNGVSNGTPLPPDVLLAEAEAGPFHGTPAGVVGPPPNQHHFDNHGGNHHPQSHNNHHNKDHHSHHGQHSNHHQPHANHQPHNHNHQSYPQNNHAGHNQAHHSNHQNNYAAPHLNNNIGHGQHMSHPSNHPHGSNPGSNYLPPKQQPPYGGTNPGPPFITPTPNIHPNHQVPNNNLYNANAPKIKFVPQLPQTGRGPYITTNPPLNHHSPTTPTPFHGTSPVNSYSGPTNSPIQITHQHGNGPFVTPNSGAIPNNNIPNINQNFVTPVPNIQQPHHTPVPLANNGISFNTPIPNQHIVSHSTISPLVHRTNHPTAAAIQFSTAPGPNPILTGMATNNLPGSTRAIKTTHILSELNQPPPPPQKLNNVQINGLSNQELHSMMAFVHTMQSTPSEVATPTPHVPHHPHDPLPHSGPQVNLEIQNPGINGQHNVAPTPKPSVIQRPLFDPKNILVNNPSIPQTPILPPVIQTKVSDIHGQSQPLHPSPLQSHPTTPLPLQQSFLPQDHHATHPETHHEPHHEPHQSHHTPHHEPHHAPHHEPHQPHHHSTPAPQHVFAVKDHHHPPMMPALAGTTTECRHPDGSGGYTCTTFGTTKRPVFDGHGIGLIAGQGSRIKRKEVNKGSNNKETNIKSSLPSMDFNLVLSPQSTQLLKQMFHTNHGNNGQYQQATTTQIPPTTSILTPISYSLPQSKNPTQKSQNINQQQPLVIQLGMSNQQLEQQNHQKRASMTTKAPTFTLPQNSQSKNQNQPLIIQLGLNNQQQQVKRESMTTNAPSIILLGQEPTKQNAANVAYSVLQQQPNIHIKTPSDEILTTTQGPVKVVVHNLNEIGQGSLNVADNFHTNQGYRVTKSAPNVYRQQEVTLTHVNPSKTPIGHQPNTINNSPRLDISSPPLVPAIAGTTTQCQLPDGHGTYTCISFENIHPENKRFSIHHSSRRSDQVTTESKLSPKYALVKSKSFNDKHLNKRKSDGRFSASVQKTHGIQQSMDERGKLRNENESNMYLKKYGYGKIPSVELQPKRSIQYQNLQQESITNNHKTNILEKIEKKESVETIFKSELGVENYETTTHIVEENLTDYETSTESEVEVQSLPEMTDENKISKAFSQKVPKKIKAYNETKENILQMRKEKINAIIEKAVKRALKFNGGNNNIHQKVFNKAMVLEKEKAIPSTTTTTHQYEETALVTEKPGYAPILNPITGKPLGLVSNKNGKFFAIDYGENDPDTKTTTELSKTTKFPIYETTKSINPNNIDLEDTETTTGRYKQPQIDPTLESLTREFMDLVQGEKSAISPPIYVR